jgi:hypothetical protein
MALLFDSYLAQRRSGPSVDVHEIEIAEMERKLRYLKQRAPEKTQLADSKLAELRDIKTDFRKSLTDAFNTERLLEKALDADIAETQVVLADNVAQYFFDSSSHNWTVADFPVVSPPFPVTWMEFSRPQNVEWKQDVSRWALWVVAGEVGADEPWDKSNSAFDFCLNSLACDERPRWLMRAMLYCRFKNNDEVWGPLAIWFMALNDEGEALAHTMHELPRLKGTGFALDLRSCFYCCLLTLTLMHCKNVVRVDNSATPTISKNWRKKHGRPLVNFKTLNIAPLKTILRREGSADQSNLKLSLHICRGHFRDYRQRGLFGKHRGIYWWDSFVRGSAESGITVKNYSLSAK